MDDGIDSALLLHRSMTTLPPLTAIGTVISPFKEKFGTPRQPGLVNTTVGRIRLRDDLNSDAFEGLAEYSHVWILFYFHSNHRDGRTDHSIKTKVHPPRLGGKAIGVFATRSPHRPNPIGLSLVEVVGVDGRELIVRGIDMIDGTPVLDIKPYMPTIESKPDAKEGWSATVPERTVTCTWEPQALADLTIQFGQDQDTAKAAIESILSLDPRPVVYRGTRENPNPYTSQYGFRFESANIVYVMETPGIAKVLYIEPWSDS